MAKVKGSSTRKQVQTILAIGVFFAAALASLSNPEFFLEEAARVPGESGSVAKNSDLKEDYVTDLRASERHYEPVKDGVVEYCPLDSLSRPVCAYAELTSSLRETARSRERLPIVGDPPGWQGNREVVIPGLEDVDGSRDYRGWFWNRSHLIADSLGGSAGPENLVTGTRMQKVGSTQTGGMAFTETIAREWLDQQQDDSCPLYYAATPEYVGEELVPRSVRVDMRSCDGAVDMGVTVLNTANGYGINYSTGEFTANH
ncbi:DNA/RNA non-specific endonuclease [Leucobacter chinensis]|uniref:DNA/RNA non-specific endonuclease n=1 Tax=Leucobacter chinensis TaxID=2851010 RepID=UPI001C24231A|nr:DNA/RNA non-specific endonuclease [Leucobacter chinensis]